MIAPTDTLVIGAGQAGLAMSRCLSDRGREHLVLERGRVAQRWRSERWDSFTLLSPNWQTRLPGHRYRGPDPDGFMAGSEVAAFLEHYARGAPVRGRRGPRTPAGDAELGVPVRHAGSTAQRPNVLDADAGQRSAQ